MFHFKYAALYTDTYESKRMIHIVYILYMLLLHTVFVTLLFLQRHRLPNAAVKRLSHATTTSYSIIHVTLIPLTIYQKKKKKAIITTDFFILFGALNYSNIAKGQLKWKREHADPAHYALLNIDLWFNICFPTAMTMCYYLDRRP